MQIKICGLSSPETIDAAIDAGTTHIGLVHFARSPRHLSLERAATLADYARGRVRIVLLTVDADDALIDDALGGVKPDILQLHGHESPAYCAALRARSGTEVWKAIGVKDRAAFSEISAYEQSADRILLDAPSGRLPGGNGDAFDWGLLAENRPNMPWGLAGGLNPDNVAAAIRATTAPLVDTSSGVESAPGVKSIDKIRAFCKAAREAGI